MVAKYFASEYCAQDLKNYGNKDVYSFVTLLKSCAKLKDLERGKEVHDAVCAKGLERNLFIGTTLVCMYASCGLLTRALEVFDKLSHQDAVSWNTLIAGYAQHGHGKEALQCLQQMQNNGFLSDSVTYLCSLKACSSLSAIRKGQEVHALLATHTYIEKYVKVGNALVDMYAKHGLFSKAKEVLHVLLLQDSVTWNSLIAGYIKHGLPQEALSLFEQMQSEGVFPDSITLACSLKACGVVGAVVTGHRIHVEIHDKQLIERDSVVGNALVDMYAKCGMLIEAQAVFDKISQRDTVGWTSLITGYANHGFGEQAIDCYEQMRMQGISLDEVTLLCSLKACSIAGASVVGQEIHAEITRRGLMGRDLVGNTLVDMYAKCGLLAIAQEVFDVLSNQDVVSWNALIGGYVTHGFSKEALDGFEQMQLDGIMADAVTFVCLLGACGSIGVTHRGFEMHTEIVRTGLIEKDIVLGNALIDMYSKWGQLAKAQEVFDTLPARDVASWNALIAGYIQHGFYHEALQCYEQIQVEQVPANTATYASILKACGDLGAAGRGLQIHAELLRNGLLKKETILGNVLVDVYCSWGSLAKSLEVFEGLSFRNVVTWTALIDGFIKHGNEEQALAVFEEMQVEHLAPNDITYVCILTACGNLGAAEKGQAIHHEITRMGLLKENCIISNAMIDMYARLGLVTTAQEVLDKLSSRDIISWSSLIAGYAQVGETGKVFYMLKRMETEGETPNLLTLMSVLNSCSHAGLVDEGQHVFAFMRKGWGLAPNLEHHTCMLDLLGRAGQLHKLLMLITRMPFHPSLFVWHAMLGACRKWGHVKLGRQAFEYAVQLEQKDGSAFVCMSNIYADADMVEDLEMEKQAFWCSECIGNA